ncbi:hypothetical protein [Amycolatopsis nigrescens]|uniref:hypothetical protein n=1 Tax=Amycolatopsis nigrescens TaxID=381445 RepID=UPI00037527FA|nr:hypothetical protein [Amycolatopsis nigrescens]
MSRVIACRGYPCQGAGWRFTAYEPIRQARRAGATARTPRDPSVTAEAILKLVDLPEPPLRLFLGSYSYPIAEKVYQQRLATWQQWRELSETA